MCKDYLTIGKDKNGEWDFGACCIICSIPPEEIKEFRSMCLVAFRVADNMWMDEQERKDPPSCCKDTK